VKEVGFKLGVKERWSYRCTEWCFGVTKGIQFVKNVLQV